MNNAISTGEILVEMTSSIVLSQHRDTQAIFYWVKITGVGLEGLTGPLFPFSLGTNLLKGRFTRFLSTKMLFF